MAGHSKWANIQHRKGRQDEKRGRIWTRLIREIVVAARHGGGDLAMNPRLRLAVEKAKAANMPADTIKKNVDKATGNLEGTHYEEVRYEGYGIGGAAYCAGARLDANYPVSVITDGMGVNITVMSYCGSVDVGIVADRGQVPDVNQVPGP